VHTVSPTCLDDGTVPGPRHRYAAPAFRLRQQTALAVYHQDLRRDRAERWRERADQLQDPALQLRCLRNAVGAAPDQADLWLELASLARWITGRRSGLAYLEEATAALPWSPPQDRRDTRREIALLRSWIHYDLAEWEIGLAWADSASRLHGNVSTKLITALLTGGSRQGQEAERLARAQVHNSLFGTPHWANGIWSLSMGMYYARKWDDRITPWLMQNSGKSFRPENRWLDAGVVFESRRHWQNATSAYHSGFHALPLVDNSCLQQYAQPAAAANGGDPGMPFWVAFDRHFVTGSWLGYAEFALGHFRVATTPVETAFWAQATLDATTACLHKYYDRPQLLAWRGALHSRTGELAQGEADLTEALSEYQKRDLPTARIKTWLGYGKLQQDRFREALPWLRQATREDPDLAHAWSHLGFVLVQLEQPDKARSALDRALALDQNLAAAWYNRGLLNFHEKRWPEAVVDLEQAARLAPTNPEIIATLQRATLANRR